MAWVQSSSLQKIKRLQKPVMLGDLVRNQRAGNGNPGSVSVIRMARGEAGSCMCRLQGQPYFWVSLRGTCHVHQNQMQKKALRRGTALGGSLKRTAALLQLGAQEG